MGRSFKYKSIIYHLLYIYFYNASILFLNSFESYLIPFHDYFILELEKSGENRKKNREHRPLF
ncbi:MAG TPA: hypothetical protein VFD03_12305, partial [Clostridia bacterium]|nr:hypothetical protein [Clostridia bacterium]